MNKTFKNPYIAENGELIGECHKQNTWISETDWSYVKSLRLSTGTLTTTISILFSRLANELAKRGLNGPQDSQRFEHLVGGLEIKLPDDNGQPGSAVGVTTPTQHQDNVTGGTPGDGGANPQQSVEHSSTSQPAPRGKGRKARVGAGD